MGFRDVNFTPETFKYFNLPSLLTDSGTSTSLLFWHCSIFRFEQLPIDSGSRSIDEDFMFNSTRLSKSAI